MYVPVVTVLTFLFALVKATRVEITQEWKPNFGWEVTCSWTLYMNDTLQSVSLSKNKQQFFIYRAVNQYGGTTLRRSGTWNLAESTMKVNCIDAVDSGMKGKCVLTLEPHVAPTRDFTFGCEVSGERPYFRMDEKEVTVEALVPPSNAVMEVITPESGPVTLNCTTSGLPAPSIIWTVDGLRVPHNFHGTQSWNRTSKLFHVWSTFRPQPDELEKVQCTPEVLKGSQVVRALAAQYNDGFRILLDGTTLIISAMATLLL